MAASNPIIPKGGVNHISVSYLSPMTNLGDIGLLDKPTSGTQWLTANGTTKVITIVGNLAVTDEAFGSSWDGSVNVPTKNAVYDKITSLGIATGIYTPTFTNKAGIVSSTTGPANYIRVIDQVMVFGVVNAITLGTVGADAQLGISLPIASNLAANTDLSGTATAYANPALAAVVLADTGLHGALLQLVTPTNLGPHTMRYSFGYRIL